MSQIVAMSKSLQDYEHIIEDLRKRIFLRGDSHSSPISDDEQPEIPSAQEEGSHSDRNKDGQSTTTHPKSRVGVETPVSGVLLSDLSVDEHGKVRHQDTVLTQ